MTCKQHYRIDRSGMGLSSTGVTG